MNATFAEPSVSIHLPKRHWCWLTLVRHGRAGQPAPDDVAVELGVDLVDRNTIVGVLSCPSGIRPEEFDVIRGHESEWTILRIGKPEVCNAHLVYEITASK